MARTCFVHSVYALENTVEAFLGDTDAVVGHDYSDLVEVLAETHTDSAAFRCIVDAVGDEIQYDLTQPVAVCFKHYRPVMPREHQLCLLLFCRTMEGDCCFMDEFCYVDPVDVERDFLPFDFGEVQKVSDQSVEPLAFIMDDLQELHFSLFIFDFPGHECFGKAFDTGYRRFELVRYIGDKITAHFFKAPYIRYIMQYDDDALLLPSLAVIWCEVRIHDTFFRIVGVDFVMHFPVVFEHLTDKVAEPDAFADFIKRLTDDIL